MRRDRDSRRPQRRGFDDDNFAPPPRDFSYPPRGPSTGARQEVPSGPPVQATVRWYNPEKGFGFVQLADTGGDAFLHVSVVERAGHANIPPGATLEVRTAPGQKGPQVTEILNLDTSTATQEPPRRPRPERPAYPMPDQPAVEEFGTVKFYAADRGFGFIARDHGGKDVFFHVSVLTRSGLTTLVEGQQVAVDVIEGRKGPEASGIRLI